MAFTVPQAQEGGWETVSHCKHHGTTGEENDRWNRAQMEAPRGPWLQGTIQHLFGMQPGSSQLMAVTLMMVTTSEGL